MAPFLIVTKSSPPSGGVRKKVGVEITAATVNKAKHASDAELSILEPLSEHTSHEVDHLNFSPRADYFRRSPSFVLMLAAIIRLTVKKTSGLQ